MAYAGLNNSVKNSLLDSLQQLSKICSKGSGKRNQNALGTKVY